jgi:hypothetical protein
MGVLCTELLGGELLNDMFASGSVLLSDPAVRRAH